MGINKQERDRLILQLRQRGWTLRKIAHEVGMSANGVYHVLNRLGGVAWRDADD